MRHINISSGARGILFQRAVACYWTAYLGAQLWIFSRSRVDFFDAFENLRGARTLAGTNLGYLFARAPMLPLLHAPLQWMLDSLGAGPIARLAAPHVFQCLISACCLAVLFRYLKLFFSAGWAHLGTIFFSLNRMTLHYFGSVLSDIPAALFFLVFLLYLENGSSSTGRRSKALLAAAAMACSVLCRWNMPVLCAAALGMKAVQKPKDLPRWIGIAAAGAFIYMGTCALFYNRVLGVPWKMTPRLIAYLYDFLYHDLSRVPPKPWWTYARALYTSGGILPSISLLAGAGAAFFKGRESFRFQGLLFACFFCTMSFGLGPKESRYLFPILPFFYSLALLGLQWIWSLRWKNVPRSARFLGVAVAVVFALSGPFREWIQFQDPVYRDEILLEAVRAVESFSAPGTRVFWTGGALSLFPTDPVFIPEDRFYYVYHVPSVASVSYLLGKTVPEMNDALFKTLRPGDLMIRAPHNLFIVGESWNPSENRLEVVRRTGGGWERVALFSRF